MKGGKELAEFRIGEFTSEYFERVYYYCLKKTGSETEAAELSQDIALGIIEQLRRGACPDSFSGWVWQIVRNIYAGWATEKHKTRERLSDTDISEFEIPDNSDFVSDLIREDDIAAIRREMAFILSEYRNVLLMYYIQSKRVCDIAKNLGIPEGTVKTRLFRAREKLKEGMYMAREFGKRSYNPEKLSFSASGSQPSGLPWRAVQRKIPVNILCEANNNPSTVEELAIELGIAAPYMEDEVDILEKSELLKKLDDGKYITNFFIAPSECIEEVNELCEDFAYDNYKKFWHMASDFVAKHYAEFIGESTMSEQDATMFFFLELVTTVKETSDGAAWGRFKRKDGGSWGFIGYEQGARHGRINACSFSDNGVTMRDDCNKLHLRGYIGDNVRFGKRIYKDSCFYIDSNDIIVIRELVKNGYGTKGFTDLQKNILDRFCDNGYFVKDGDRYKPTILIFEGDKLSELINLMICEHREEYDALVAAMKKLYDDTVGVIAKYSVPCLKDDFDYYVCAMLYKMRGCVAALVKDNGLYTGGNGDFGYFSYEK